MTRLLSLHAKIENYLLNEVWPSPREATVHELTNRALGMRYTKTAHKMVVTAARRTKASLLKKDKCLVPIYNAPSARDGSPDIAKEEAERAALVENRKIPLGAGVSGYILACRENYSQVVMFLSREHRTICKSKNGFNAMLAAVKRQGILPNRGKIHLIEERNGLDKQE